MLLKPRNIQTEVKEGKIIMSIDITPDTLKELVENERLSKRGTSYVLATSTSISDNGSSNNFIEVDIGDLTVGISCAAYIKKKALNDFYDMVTGSNQGKRLEDENRQLREELEKMKAMIESLMK